MAVLALLLRSSLAAAAAEDIKCASGWGQEERVIPSEWINDGYCDCPLNGLDEQGTEACSGSVVGGWAGVESSSDARCVYILLSSVGLILELEAGSHFYFFTLRRPIALFLLVSHLETIFVIYLLFLARHL